MLVLLVAVGSTRLAIEADRVEQVVPRVPLRHVPGATPYLAGLLDRRGQVLPVVDLGLRLGSTSCSERLSTRIVVTRARHGQTLVPLGLIAERVTELVELPHQSPPEPAEVAPGGLDCLGRVLRIGDDLVQWIDIDRVLSPSERAWIFDAVLGTGNHEPVRV